MIGQPGSVVWPSLNCGARRDGVSGPDIILLHYTAMPSALGARDWLCDPRSQVSAHYVIARSGLCWQLVCESRRAWHAGQGGWGASRDVNSRSIGIEIANTGFEPFSGPQMDCLHTLLAGIMRRWAIPPAHVLGHSDIAPGRKVDPGRLFDWALLAQRGLALLATAQGSAAAQEFWGHARRIGYVWQPGQELAVLDAFRSRFAPARHGALGAQDAALAASVAAQMPPV